MKISRYTFFPRLETEEGYDHYVYNALSNALMWVDEESWKVLKDVYGSGGTVDGAAIDAGLYDALVKRNVITDSDEDDFLMYKAIIIRQRAGREFMHLTLAPTMDCCFRCHYCFEKYKKEGAMTVDVMDEMYGYNQAWISGFLNYGSKCFEIQLEFSYDGDFCYLLRE